MENSLLQAELRLREACSGKDRGYTISWSSSDGEYAAESAIHQVVSDVRVVEAKGGDLLNVIEALTRRIAEAKD